MNLLYKLNLIQINLRNSVNKSFLKNLFSYIFICCLFVYIVNVRPSSFFMLGICLYSELLNYCNTIGMYPQHCFGNCSFFIKQKDKSIKAKDAIIAAEYDLIKSKSKIIQYQFLSS